MAIIKIIVFLGILIVAMATMKLMFFVFIAFGAVFVAVKAYKKLLGGPDAR